MSAKAKLKNLTGIIEATTKKRRRLREGLLSHELIANTQQYEVVYFAKKHRM